MLNKATIFEKFLGTKYIGEKRFSLEGGETAIPALESIVEQAAEEGVEEVIIGMAHRGRLNVLTNLMGKTYDEIFSEFQGFEPEKTFGDGDVKYHSGFSSLTTKSGKKVTVSLPNPSHLRPLILSSKDLPEQRPIRCIIRITIRSYRILTTVMPLWRVKEWFMKCFK